MNVVNDSNYEDVVLKSEKLVVVDFYADWCGPCKVLGPVLDKISEANGDVTFLKVNVDDSPLSSTLNGVRSIPTLVFVKDGIVLNKIVGNVSPVSIQEEITKLK
jgi:thioredoxin 1